MKEIKIKENTWQKRKADLEGPKILAKPKKGSQWKDFGWAGPSLRSGTYRVRGRSLLNRNHVIYELGVSRRRS